MTNLLHATLLFSLVKSSRRIFLASPKLNLNLESVTPSAGPILSWINVPRASPIACRTIMPGAEASF
jgi:hypothetical protein